MDKLQGNKVLLYSTGDHIQYSVINHNNMKKKKIYESLCCTAETNTKLQINYTSIKKKKTFYKDSSHFSFGPG